MFKDFFINNLLGLIFLKENLILGYVNIVNQIII